MFITTVHLLTSWNFLWEHQTIIPNSYSLINITTWLQKRNKKGSCQYSRDWRFLYQAWWDNGYKFKHGKIETNWTYSCTISLVHLNTQDFFSFIMNVFHFPFSFLVYLLMFCFTWLYYFHIYCQQKILPKIFKMLFFFS